MSGKKIIRVRWGIFILVFVGILVFLFCLPKPLFNDPACTVLNDSEGLLLAAKIADDGQWRFPERKDIPERFKTAIRYFEDEYFYKHPGINPASIWRAFRENLKAGKIVRGGSTITQQVIRLSRKGKSRSYWEKFKEMLMALRLELRYTKEEILALYTSHAPFGGNVVGLDAASWRYYGRPPENLSWGEAASLAVLPNAPALVYPGRNQTAFLQKRNKLLNKLLEKECIDNITCQLAIAEPLPGQPKDLPQLTPHLLDRVIAEGNKGKVINTTINREMQLYCNRKVDHYYNRYKENEILNAAVLVVEVESGDVAAYVGNTNCMLEGSGRHVDIITSLRSSGSILKPFLFALMMKDGKLLPDMLVPDIPTHISGYQPKNFDKRYDGAVPAGNALARSLNIPAVRMLQEYGLERFHYQLQQIPLTTINRSADHYGLSLILGGAEIKLWELTGAYASVARMLSHYTTNNSQYDPEDYSEADFYSGNQPKKGKSLRKSGLIGAGPAWLTFNALLEMDRPVEGTSWSSYGSSKKIAWKTGTSFGHRDAWAVGITPGYVVGVWIGNADGEGRPGLTGAGYAAPVLFDIFKIIPESGWFDIPYDDLTRAAVCTRSGYRASPLCESVDTIYIPVTGDRTLLCPYHKQVHLDQQGKYRVSSACYPVSKMIHRSWFVLPPVMEWYYKSKDPYYETLPPVHPSCIAGEEHNMDLIYPEENARIFIPRGFGSKKERLVCEAACREPESKIYWHLDNNYLGTTSVIHTMEIMAGPGKHRLTLVGEEGAVIERVFQIVERE